MSSEDKLTKSTIASKGAPSLAIMNGKGAAVAPKLSDDDHVEMEDIIAQGPGAIEDDIMQLARIGDVPAMEKLFEDGKFEATYCDEEGITPLHVCITGIWVHKYMLIYVVGCNQQPVCDVPVSPEGRSRCKQKRRRISRNTCDVGGSAMSLLHRTSTTRTWRGPPDYRCPRL